MFKVIDDENGNNYTVRAIIADFPKLSHINVESLCSFKTQELQKKGDMWFGDWISIFSDYTYVLPDEANDVDRLEIQLNNLAEIQNKLNESDSNLSALPLVEIVPGPDMQRMLGSFFEMEQLIKLILLTLVILISACFNYTNLFIGRSLRRTKEIGIRKTVGASRVLVFTQFMTEAVIVSLLVLLLAFGLFFVFRPLFIEMRGYSGRFVELMLTPVVLGAFIVFAILVGIVAGLFLSWGLSAMQVKAILKDVTATSPFSNVSLRKGLIIM